MIRIVHKKEVKALTHLPSEITDTMNHIVTILDESYGETRDYISDLGGYILFVENEDDLKELTKVGIDLEEILPDYVDLIKCANGEEYTSSLILLSSDYSISLIIPLQLTTKNLLDWLEK